MIQTQPVYFTDQTGEAMQIQATYESEGMLYSTYGVYSPHHDVEPVKTELAALIQNEFPHVHHIQLSRPQPIGKKWGIKKYATAAGLSILGLGSMEMITWYFMARYSPETLDRIASFGASLVDMLQ